MTCDLADNAGSVLVCCGQGGYRQMSRYQRDAAIARFIARFPTEAGLFECWRIPTRRKDGYCTYGGGAFFDGDKGVHRIAWRLANDMAPIPDGYEIDHLCFVRNCVNPLHLRCIPWQQNRYQRPRPLTTHCPQGHPKSGDNLYVNPKTGHRYCRECVRQAIRRDRVKFRDKRNAERNERRRRAS